jgi:hypothetical protein
VTRQYVGDTFLKLDGLNAVTGNFDIAKHRLMNLGDPEEQHDAVNLEFLDRFLKHDGSSQMTGTLSLGGYSITNVAQSISTGDLVTKGYAEQCCWFNSS